MNARDSAARCVALAESELRAGNRNAAKRLLQKSLRLNPSLDNKAHLLLPQCDFESHHFTPNDEKRSDYTEEDARLAAEIVGKVDYYEILGVTKTAPEEEIKRQYRRLALRLHPDKNRAPQATDAFKKLAQAFSCLSNPDKRRRYDLHGTEVSPMRMAHQQEEVDPEDLFDLFFNGRINPNRGQRRVYRRGNTYYYCYTTTEDAEEAEEGENQTGKLQGIVVRVMVVVIMVLLAIFIQIHCGVGWHRPNKEYSFGPTMQHRSYRASERAGVRYYVAPEFADKYSGAANRERLRGVEDTLELEYMEMQMKQCNNARWLKTRLEERRQYACERDKAKYAQEIRGIDTSSCDRYLLIKDRRSQ